MTIDRGSSLASVLKVSCNKKSKAACAEALVFTVLPRGQLRGKDAHGRPPGRLCAHLRASATPDVIKDPETLATPVARK